MKYDKIKFIFSVYIVRNMQKDSKREGGRREVLCQHSKVNLLMDKQRSYFFIVISKEHQQ